MIFRLLLLSSISSMVAIVTILFQHLKFNSTLQLAPMSEAYLASKNQQFISVHYLDFPPVLLR